ncbi:unnamed protein product [Staurois parvus]|uniref:Uncharacterized protein n=1 Tax=Staurois parvus TaxID=386267 RepID=A0ABN9EMX8_9NEOB|nr:unnamed protein product [Staurois parvus]
MVRAVSEELPLALILQNSIQSLESCAQVYYHQGLTDHLKTRALPKGPGCPWYLFHRLF